MWRRHGRTSFLPESIARRSLRLSATCRVGCKLGDNPDGVDPVCPADLARFPCKHVARLATEIDLLLPFYPSSGIDAGEEDFGSDQRISCKTQTLDGNGLVECEHHMPLSERHLEQLVARRWVKKVPFAITDVADIRSRWHPIIDPGST